LSKLLKLKEWLTVADAAHHLSILFEEEVSEADMLRLALDGHLKLSVRFMDPSQALCGTIQTVEKPSKCFDPTSISDEDEREDRVRREKRVLISALDNRVLDIEGEYHIDGVWDLLMLGGERAYVEDRYQTLINGPGVYPWYFDAGIYVVKEELEGKACRLRPELPDGGIPNDSFLVVRTTALQALEESLSEVDRPLERPLGNRERTTLLVVIATLLEIAKIDRKKPSKAASLIARQTELLGARVSERTILDHLSRVADALESRGSDEGVD
jgi:hypothetical protein